MLLRNAVIVSLTINVLFGAVSIRAQDAGALLDLLVRKKIITDQEAEEVRAELTREVATTSAGKWKMSAPITELEIYGDARMRYEYRGRTNRRGHTNRSARSWMPGLATGRNESVRVTASGSVCAAPAG